VSPPVTQGDLAELAVPSAKASPRSREEAALFRDLALAADPLYDGICTQVYRHIGSMPLGGLGMLDCPRAQAAKRARVGEQEYTRYAECMRISLDSDMERLCEPTSELDAYLCVHRTRLRQAEYYAAHDEYGWDKSRSHAKCLARERELCAQLGSTAYRQRVECAVSKGSVAEVDACPRAEPRLHE